MAKIPKLRVISDPDEIRPQKRVPELLRVPADKPVTGVLLVNAPFELPTHFDGSHTVICPGEDTCEIHALRQLRMYYLVAIIDRNSNGVSWYQLSDRAGLALMQQLREMEKPCYGTTVKIGRERKTMSAPIVVAVDPWAVTRGRIPKPMEPSETLERVFNSPKLGGKPNLKPL